MNINSIGNKFKNIYWKDEYGADNSPFRTKNLEQVVVNVLFSTEKLEQVAGMCCSVRRIWNSSRNVPFRTKNLEQVVVMCCSVKDISPSFNFKASNHSDNLL
jgi:regulation of enolase protein 1 (concanavalin A-like superfamily)